jgi:hypothetical protein
MLRDMKERMPKFTVAVVRMTRSMEAMTDSVRVLTDALVCEFGREWEHPEAVLSEEERDAIEARRMGRTLAEIDELPEVGQ